MHATPTLSSACMTPWHGALHKPAVRPGNLNHIITGVSMCALRTTCNVQGMSKGRRRAQGRAVRGRAHVAAVVDGKGLV